MNQSGTGWEMFKIFEQYNRQELATNIKFGFAT